MGRPFIIMLEIVFAMALLAALWLILDRIIKATGGDLQKNTEDLLQKSFDKLNHNAPTIMPHRLTVACKWLTLPMK